MPTFMERLLDPSIFSPHGFCLLWEPELLWLHVGSDLIIAASYFSIPFALAIVVSKRPDFQFGWVGWSFATFILACGLTHVFSIYTLWVPVYGIEGIVKAITAVASLSTAALLWPLLPKIIVMPTADQLRSAQLALEKEGERRRASETVLQRFKEIEANEAQVRQAQKMEAIGQLTGGIAHDFNNMLTVITGTVEILMDGVEDRPQLAEIAKLISQAAARGASLTNHLLAFARKQSLAPRDIDVDDLIGNVVDLLRPTIGANVKIRCVQDGAKHFAVADGDQLATALINLSLNARDALPQGGDIEIAAKKVVWNAQEAKKNGGLSADEYVEISVADTGNGIAEGDLNKVFEPFFTTKEVGKGTGLGLSMVYGFAKQSNGHILIESAVGVGTTVKLYLPKGNPPHDVVLNNQSGIENEFEGTPSILVVEDDPLVASYVQTQLKLLHYSTVLASSGSEALSILEGPLLVDVLFTDIIMPGGMSGRDLSLEALKLRPHLKIVLTSGFTGDVIDPAEKLEEGVLFLAKPYSRAQLSRIMRLALRKEEPGVLRQ